MNTVTTPSPDSFTLAKAKWFASMGFTAEQLEAMDDPRCAEIAAEMRKLHEATSE